MLSLLLHGVRGQLLLIYFIHTHMLARPIYDFVHVLLSPIEYGGCSLFAFIAYSRAPHAGDGPRAAYFRFYTNNGRRARSRSNFSPSSSATLRTRYRRLSPGRTVATRRASRNRRENRSGTIAAGGGSAVKFELFFLYGPRIGFCRVFPCVDVTK